MSDISLNAQQQLAQAVAQLSKLSTNSPVAKQAAQVIVQFLANNQISLTLPKQQQTVTLPRPSNLPQALNASQVQAQLQNHTSSSGNQNTTSELLLFSTSTKTNAQSVITALSQKQLSTILNALSSNISPGDHKKSILVDAKILSSSGNSLSISTQINGKAETLNINLAVSAKTLLSNQSAQLQITPKGNQWQVKLIVDSHTSTQHNALKNTQHISQSSAANNLKVDPDNVNTQSAKTTTVATNITQQQGKPELNPQQLVADKYNQNKPINNQLTQGPIEQGKNAAQKVITLNLSKPDIVKLLQSDSARPNTTTSTINVGTNSNVSTHTNISSNISLSVPRQALIDTLSKQPQLQLDNALSKLLQINNNIKTVTIDLLSAGRAEIKGPIQTPLAQLPLTEVQVKQVQATLFPQNDSKAMPIPVQSSVQSSGLRPENVTAKPDVNLKQQTELASSIISKVSANPQEHQLLPKTDSPKAAQSDAVSSAQTLQSLSRKLDSIPVAQKQQVLEQIGDLMRRVLPQAASPSDTLQNIEMALRDPMLAKSPETKAVAEAVLKLLQQSIPQGKDSDAENIKQLMTQTPLNLTPIQITQSVSSQGIVAGLMAMLQISLASRLNRNQPQNSEKLAQIVSSLIPNAGKSTTPQTQRSLNDLNQMEQKHQLLKQLGRMFAQHQSSKLSNAEQALQGQETFYYVLPSGTGEHKKDIELLIKREPEKQGGEKKQGKQSAIWHLTMKMDIGQIGQILTKAKLQQNELELDLYTSNEDVKVLVLNFLPLFKKRLKSLGIDVAKAQCQLGKIPDHLQTRPYQMFQTQA